MAKKKQKPGKRAQAEQKPPAKTRRPKRQNQSIVRALPVIRPLLFLGVVGLLMTYNKGYDRLYKENIVGLIQQMHQYKGMSYEEKLGKLLPQDYPYLSFVKKSTPPDAVILAPPRSVWQPKDQHLKFSRWISRKDYLTYFLYPRKIVFDDNNDRDNPLKQQLTHVMIVDSWGYDKLSYEVSNPQALTVMPIQH